MNSLNTFTLMSLMTLLSAVQPALACPVLSPEEQLLTDQRNKLQEQQAITTMYHQADEVFVAHAVDSQQVDEEARIYVTFSAVTWLKGHSTKQRFHYDKDNAWHFEYTKEYLAKRPEELVEHGVIRLGCVPRYDLISAFAAGSRYLVYIQAGRIIRSHQFNKQSEDHSGDEELDFLSTHGLVNLSGSNVDSDQ